MKYKSQKISIQAHIHRSTTEKMICNYFQVHKRSKFNNIIHKKISLKYRINFWLLQYRDNSKWCNILHSRYIAIKNTHPWSQLGHTEKAIGWEWDYLFLILLRSITNSIQCCFWYLGIQCLVLLNKSQFPFSLRK